MTDAVDQTHRPEEKLRMYDFPVVDVIAYPLSWRLMLSDPGSIIFSILGSTMSAQD